jgi:hypothetical protein
MASSKLRRVSMRWQRGEEVSYIRMSGRWLADLGFAMGANFEVQAEPGRLVLVVREPGPQSADGESPDTKTPTPREARRGE